MKVGADCEVRAFKNCAGMRLSASGTSVALLSGLRSMVVTMPLLRASVKAASVVLPSASLLHQTAIGNRRSLLRQNVPGKAPPSSRMFWPVR